MRDERGLAEHINGIVNTFDLIEDEHRKYINRVRKHFLSTFDFDYHKYTLKEFDKKFDEAFGPPFRTSLGDFKTIFRSYLLSLIKLKGE